MNKQSKIILLSFSLTLFYYFAHGDNGFKTVIVTGQTVKRGSFIDDKRLAIINGLKSAVEQISGVDLKSEAIVENGVLKKQIINVKLAKRGFELIEYKVLYEPKGYVELKNSKIIEVLLEVKFVSSDVVIDSDPINIQFVFITGGCYQMGCGNWTSDCDEDEKPLLRICVDDFLMGKYEITQGKWREV